MSVAYPVVSREKLEPSLFIILPGNFSVSHTGKKMNFSVLREKLSEMTLHFSLSGTYLCHRQREGKQNHGHVLVWS